MGTRSTIKFYENEEFLCAIYQQFDGYIEGGVGEEIKKFIKSKKFVNGISPGEYQKVFNGFGCFIAQFIKHFKREAGGLYITHEEDEQSFNYTVKLYNSGTIDEKIIVRETSEDYPTYTETFIINLHS